MLEQCQLPGILDPQLIKVAPQIFKNSMMKAILRSTRIEIWHLLCEDGNRVYWLQLLELNSFEARRNYQNSRVI